MIPRKTTGNIPDDQTQNTPSVFDDDAANDNERAEEAQEEEGSILETEVESVPSTSAKRSLANTHLLETTPTAPMKRKKKKKHARYHNREISRHRTTKTGAVQRAHGREYSTRWSTT